MHPGAAARRGQGPARQAGAARVEGNPFSTRYLRPGALDFRFPPGDSLEGLCARLEQHGWWGQIVGPHGSGKSTLLESLAPLLSARGRRIVRFTLRAGERRLPLARQATRTWNHATQVVVDGYEQLGRLSRWRLRRACRRSGCGLLVTAHRSAGFFTLIRTTVTPDIAQSVAETLCPGGCEALLAKNGDSLGQLLARHDGNLREVLFDLYDLYQSQRA